MSDFIRRLVSGPKARFKDSELKLELDLVYVTESVVIMGYPAAGLESIYRNRRQDAKRFLDHRHGKNYWVFNFCPIRENSYEKSVFEGRVTRFPFPDHHAPPLALLPLVAREVRAWLDGFPDRVAVFHCKAGKGRSGTMACAYLLSLSALPSTSALSASTSVKRKMAESLTNETINQIPLDSAHSILEDENAASSPKFGYNDDPLLPYPPSSPLATTQSVTHTANQERSFVDALKGVLDLHTATRMKSASPKPTASSDAAPSAGTTTSPPTSGQVSIPSADKKQRQGVSIPSQRRWLYYWALMLEGGAPRGLLHGQPSSANTTLKPLIRITDIRIRMREPGGVRQGIVRAANVVLDKAIGFRKKSNENGKDENDESDDSVEDTKSHLHDVPFTSGANKLWASIARYDDRLVEFLDRWEAHTRAPQDGMAGNAPGENTKPGESDLSRIETEFGGFGFDEDGTWDKEKMVRNFARFGVVSCVPVDKGVSGTLKEEDEEAEKRVLEYRLKLVSDKRARVRVDVNTGEVRESADDNRGGEVVEPPTIVVDGGDERHEEGEGKQLGDKSDVSSIASSALRSYVGQQEKVPSKDVTEREGGLVVEGSRELRIKLYVGKVFIGWMWFIPSFHMSPSTGSSMPATSPKTTFNLGRKDVDFALGLGSAIIDVDIDMEWVVNAILPAAATVTTPGPVRIDGTSHSLDVAEGGEMKGGAVGLVQAVSAAVHGGLRDAAEVGQATGV